MDSEEKKTILFVVSSLEVGGIETYLLNFLKFSGNTIRPIVLCKSGRGGLLQASYEASGIEVVKLKLGVGVSVRFFRFYQLLKSRKIDGVCDFTGDFAGLVMVTAALAGVPKRISFYRGSAYQFRPTLLRVAFARFLGRLVFRFSTQILSNSETALDVFQRSWRQYQGRVQVIRNPAPDPPPTDDKRIHDLRKAIGISESAFVVAHIGRVSSAKNHDFILSVAETLISEDKNIFFVLCGRGLHAKFSSSIIGSNIEKNIRLFEYRDDIHDVLKCADAFFFPSLNEGMPNALVEAMAVGCPCIASDISSIREVFPPSYSEYLVDPHDKNMAISLIKRIKSEARTAYSKDLVNWTKENFNRKATFGAFLALLKK